MSEHACAKILCADARALPFPDASVDLIVTSPPYWGQRSDGSEIGDESLATVYVKNLLDCTREMVRVLQPAGSIFVNLGDKYSGAGRER